jgi:hypothetical protein
MLFISICGKSGSGKTVITDYIKNKYLPGCSYCFPKYELLLSPSYSGPSKNSGIIIMLCRPHKPIDTSFADYIIINDGTIDDLKRKIDIIIMRGKCYTSTSIVLCCIDKVPRLFKNSKFKLPMDLVRKLCSEFL